MCTAKIHPRLFATRDVRVFIPHGGTNISSNANLNERRFRLSDSATNVQLNPCRTELSTTTSINVGADLFINSEVRPTGTTSTHHTLRPKRRTSKVSDVEGAGEPKHYAPIIVQHDYHDHANDAWFSTPPASHGSIQGSHSLPAHNGGVAVPFPIKLYETLLIIENDGHGDAISWQPHGRCFVVRKPELFKKVVMPRYFMLTKVASFQRQLNLYGFKRLTKGKDKGGYYHELFLRGRPDLVQTMHRVKVKGTHIRAKSNPDAEPDFWDVLPWMNVQDPLRNIKAQADPVPATVTSHIQKVMPTNTSLNRPRANVNQTTFSQLSDHAPFSSSDPLMSRRIIPTNTYIPNSFNIDYLGVRRPDERGVREDCIQNPIPYAIEFVPSYHTEEPKAISAHNPLDVEFAGLYDDIDPDCLMNELFEEDKDFITVLEQL